MLKWCVFCQLALFMLEKECFGALVCYLHEGLGGLSPKAAPTLRGWISTEHNNQKRLLAVELSRSVRKVHITFDIWTAHNQRGQISVWGYRISQLAGNDDSLLSARSIALTLVKSKLTSFSMCLRSIRSTIGLVMWCQTTPSRTIAPVSSCCERLSLSLRSRPSKHAAFGP